ncbi:50S ribosomal protein L10 [Aliikangiella sp. G2MR2-5]|uniref:50S ribosomal protein L10 n=1 Tax=Aliikangiella sp. G2MR2-5 TaxID=2788943 RepID=UPI0018A9B8AC
MALGLEGKKQIVAEVNEIASTALSAVLAEYRGMTVEDMTALRVKARESGVYLRVVRNTLAKRAVEDTEFACLNDALVGQVISAFSLEEPGAAARLIRDFAKNCDKLVTTAVAVGGELHGPEKLEAVAKLPTKDEAIASLMSVMNGPVTKLARTLNEFPSRITRVIAAVKDQKAA